MTTFEWFLLIVVVIVVPLIVAVVVTLWTIDQANKRKRANRKDAQIGVKRKAALSPEEVEAHRAARAARLQAEAATGGTAAVNTSDSPKAGPGIVTSSPGGVVMINNHADDSPVETDPNDPAPGNNPASSAPDADDSHAAPGTGGSDSNQSGSASNPD